jgi:hypothetical protein
VRGFEDSTAPVRLVLAVHNPVATPAS